MPDREGHDQDLEIEEPERLKLRVGGRQKDVGGVGKAKRARKGNNVVRSGAQTVWERRRGRLEG